MIAAFINVVTYWSTHLVLSPSCVPDTANLSRMICHLVQKWWIVAGLLETTAAVQIVWRERTEPLRIGKLREVHKTSGDTVHCVTSFLHLAGGRRE